ncbi:MAG: serine hydrolase family protein [Salinarimonadaceae bacterium]|nr:MAG: serine hydrolase family protein [Salinarimonadaceae bacterium]
MKTSDCDILILPSLGGPDGEIWLSRWERQLSSARIVAQADWARPEAGAWASSLHEAAGAATRPVVLVGHGLGSLTVAHAAAQARDGKNGERTLERVAGAFLVAAPDIEDDSAPAAMRGFGPMPRARLPFATLLVASRNDPHCAFERAEELAGSWGAELVDAGESAHLDTAAGFGPWPEGLLRFAGFLKTLPATQ